MSDLFRQDPPRMSDDESRRAWERVRTAAAREPWWAALWSRPAVRFGLPAAAVVLVAGVWVAIEQPATTHVPVRPLATLDQAGGGAASSPQTAAPEAPPPGAAIEHDLAQRPSNAPRPQAFAKLPTPVREARLAKRSLLAESGATLDQKDVAKEEKAAGAPAAPGKVTALQAPAPVAANEVAPVNESAARGETFGVLRAAKSNDSLAGVRVRGGRADEYSYQYDASTGVLAVVGPLVRTRPLRFTAPLPVAIEAGATIPPRVSIELGPNGGATIHVVGAAPAAGFAGAPAAGSAGAAADPSAHVTYARYEDAPPAEQILLVAYAADHAPAAPPPSLIKRLLAEAQRLETAERNDQGEQSAAQALLARLKAKGWGAPSTR
jgi:hypothetical protein